MTVHTIKLNVTDKEKNLVTLIADGYSVNEISKMLSINLRTLEGNVVSLKKKYKSNNLPNLVATFLRNKLID